MQRARHQKLLKALRTLSLCVAFVFVLCMGVFLCPPDASYAVEIPLLYRESQFVGDSQNDADFRLQFRTPTDQTLIFPLDTSTYSFHITFQELQSQLPYSNGDLSYGTEASSNSARWALYYPFSGTYVFPPVDGVVDHYEMDFRFKVKSSFSAECFQRAYPNLSGQTYMFQPHSSVSFAVFGYMDKSGVYREVDTNSDWISIEFYHVRDLTQSLTVSSDNINYWNTVHSWNDYECQLRVRIDSFPEDFSYFVSSYIFFGRNFYFYNYSTSIREDAYFEVEPMVSELSTVYMTGETYDSILQESTFRDDLVKPTPGMQNFIDDVVDDASGSLDGSIQYHDDWEDAINEILAGYGYTPEDKADEWDVVLGEVLSHTVPSFMGNVWSFYDNHFIIGAFLSLAGIFIFMVFVLRR